MAARVYITHSTLQGETFVLSGHLVSGELSAGMELVVALNSSLSLAFVIDEVERGDGPKIRLIIRNAEDAEMLATLNVCEEEVEVRPAG